MRACRPGGVDHQAGGVARAIGSRRQRHRDLDNWSGYAVTGANGSFHSVSASWTEPTATCSGSAEYASFWVGLDGYNSNSVEQTGTEADCDGRTGQYYGWYEMYPATR